jgi:hypothetical protein
MVHVTTSTATGTPRVGDRLTARYLVAEPSTDFGVRISTMRHEVMHAQLHAGVGCMPAWFNEGAAQYFAGRPPLQTWMTMLKEREAFDFDALAAPTIVEAPKEDASKLYAQTSTGAIRASIARRWRASRGGEPSRMTPAIPGGAFAVEDTEPGVGGDQCSALAQRIRRLERARLDGVFDNGCCSGGRRIDDLSCRAAPAGSEAVTSDERCRRY